MYNRLSYIIGYVDVKVFNFVVYGLIIFWYYLILLFFCLVWLFLIRLVCDFMSFINFWVSFIGKDLVEVNLRREKDFLKGLLLGNEGFKWLRVWDRIDNVENVGVCKIMRFEGRWSEWMEGEV